MVERIVRCDWAKNSKLEERYHDMEWGKPVHDDKKLFKMLILEGKQAVLSWNTILLKMDSLCEAFDNFDPGMLIKYDERKIESLMNNSGIIRNRQKINAVINNAKRYFELCEKHSSLDSFFWNYVDFKQIINKWEDVSEIPTQTPLSQKISNDLKKLGFKFVGPTIIYAFMQSVGMVNDHLLSCSFRNIN